jgi:hypothetical protein
MDKKTPLKTYKEGDITYAKCRLEIGFELAAFIVPYACLNYPIVE